MLRDEHRDADLRHGDDEGARDDPPNSTHGVTLAAREAATNADDWRGACYHDLMTARSLKRALETLADREKAAFFPRFFKTCKGQYGEGDVFVGVTVPQIRTVVRQHRGMPLSEIEKLLRDEIHECRLAAVLLLVERFERGDESTKKGTVDFYLSHLDCVNNWDLVDSSAAKILGAHLKSRDRTVLETLASSGDLWKERVSVVATYAFIREGEYAPTLHLAKKFLRHRHDLIHKAVGWMLREVGKKDAKSLKDFLDEFAASMPRTMLRYAIEKFDASERARYLRKK